MTEPTPKEMEILHAAKLIKEKLLWLREHPGKTRRDYQRALRNGALVKWRIAGAEASIEAEETAWLADHPGNPLPEHRCSLTDAETEKYYQWLSTRYCECKGLRAAP